MKRKALSGEQGAPKRRATEMSVSGDSIGAEEKQYVIMDYDKEKNVCWVAYTRKRPVRTTAQRLKGWDVMILGPQNRDELQLAMYPVLLDMRSGLKSDQEDSRSEEPEQC